ncbi:MAG: hypothetical protein EBR67_04215, partial [Proteobacteria bacterium]|nr:hypothetical protein [Pseudomonadota bacterium]
LKQAQNSTFALLSKQLASTKSSGRLDTISKDLVLRMQAPVYARDDVRKYNLALTLMRNLGPKEFAKPAEKNGEFINVYKRIQDAFSIAGDKEIGKEFAKNIHEIISPILEGPIDHDLEESLGASVVKSIKEMRKQVWANAEDLMLSSANVNKLTPKPISYRAASGTTTTETLRDQSQVLKGLVDTIKDLYIDNDFKAEEKLVLTVRDLAYEPQKYAMMAADAKALKKNLQAAISGEAGKVTPVAIPVASLSDSQKKTSIEDMLLQSAKKVKAAEQLKIALNSAETGFGNLPRDYSVAKVKLQSEIAKKIESCTGDAQQSFTVGGVTRALNKQELQDISNVINSSTLVKVSDISNITSQRGESQARVDAKQAFLEALLNEDRLGQIEAANKVIDTESKAFDQIVQKLVEGPTGVAASNLTGIKDVANDLNNFLTDGKLDLQKLADSRLTASSVLVDAGKINKVLTETGTTEIAFQLRNDKEGKQLGYDLLKVVQADYDKYNKFSAQATRDSDNVVNAVVSSLNKAGLTSVAHRILESFHSFITNGDPQSGEIGSDKVKDALEADNSANGGLGSVAQEMTDYIGSKQAAQGTQIAMLKNEQAQKLSSIASKVSFGKTSGMTDLAILDHITGQSPASASKENAIANFIDFAADLYQKTKDNGKANGAFNISDEDIRKLLVVDQGDDLALAERDVNLKKIMLTVLNGLNTDRSQTQAVVNAKGRLVDGNIITLPSSSDISKFSKEADKLASNFESRISELEFSTAGKSKYDSFDELLAVEQNGDSSGGVVRPDASNLLKRMVKVFTGLFMGNRSDAISAYLAGLVDKVKHDDSNDAFNNGLHAAFQP